MELGSLQILENELKMFIAYGVIRFSVASIVPLILSVVLN